MTYDFRVKKEQIDELEVRQNDNAKQSKTPNSILKNKLKKMKN